MVPTLYRESLSIICGVLLLDGRPSFAEGVGTFCLGALIFFGVDAWLGILTPGSLAVSLLRRRTGGLMEHGVGGVTGALFEVVQGVVQAPRLLPAASTLDDEMGH